MPTASLLSIARARRSVVAAVICAATMVLLPTFVGATSVMQLTDPQLTALSSIVAEGRVTSVHSEWNSGRTEIHTIVTIRVARTLKGSPPSRGLLVLRLKGGQVGDLAMVISGQPTFHVDEDVIVFVSEKDADVFPITGMSQGKLTVAVNPATGVAMIQERDIALDAFVRDIERIVSAEGGR